MTMSPSYNDFLVVRGEDIVLGNEPIILKGTYISCTALLA